jgi:hypothetical protein
MSDPARTSACELRRDLAEAAFGRDGRPARRSRRSIALAPVIMFAMIVGIASPAIAVLAQAGAADLARARTAYNERRFDEAIVAATMARRVAETADAASIVLVRALLERYRERADPSDLSTAREVLGTVRASALTERDRLELLLAFGEALFLEDDFGAAAEILESGIARAAVTAPDLAEAMLEWWASAVERQASLLPPEPRKAQFSRLIGPMSAELARVPTSPAASYWMVVGLWGSGDVDRAWDAAVAGWVRARLAGDRAASLRADLDHLVLQGVIPDRVRHIALDQRAAAESQLKAEWELVKERWK